jgi:hypothetical protein
MLLRGELGFDSLIEHEWYCVPGLSWFLEMRDKILVEFAQEVGATLERADALVKKLEAQLHVVGVAGIETRSVARMSAIPLLPC